MSPSLDLALGVLQLSCIIFSGIQRLKLFGLYLVWCLLDHPLELMSLPRFGSQTLASVGISLLVVVAAFLAIRPKFSEGRLRLDNKHLLTPMEVQAIPDGVLPVVLGRDLGDTEREFKTQLLRLIMERSGVDFDFGLTAEDLSQDAAINALASGQLVGEKNPHAITIGAYGAGRALNARLRAIPIPITGEVVGLRVGWTHDKLLPKLASSTT